MIRKPTADNPPKVGDYVLRSSIFLNGVVMAPRRVVEVKRAMLTAVDDRTPAEPPHRMALTSIAYVTPDKREADDAYAVSEQFRRSCVEARDRAVKDIEAINREPIV